MGQLAVATAGAVVGFMIAGPTGAQIGWTLGSAVGGAMDQPMIAEARIVDGEPCVPLRPAALEGAP